MAFPSTARNGQTHNQFGKKFSYSEASGAWSPAVPLASVAEVRIREKVAETATASYATAVELPLTGNTAGQMAFVQETNRLYVWSGTGWYNVATVTSAAAAISGANSTYTLATDGTPTVVTLSQSGLTSPTWSYAVTSSSLGRTAVVTQADNIFTITPSALAKDVGSFGLTFKATDGSNTIAYSSKFTMSNTAPVIGTAPSAAYTLASDGTPTIITLAATDADGHAITWSYEVVSGSLGGTAVSIVGSVFTITPSIDTNDAGEFQLRFIASDGASFDAEVAEFALGFGPTYDYTVDDPSDYGTAFLDWFGVVVAEANGRLAVSAQAETNASGHNGAVYIFDKTTGSKIRKISNPYSGPNSQNSDVFGKSMAISDNYLLVGNQTAMLLASPNNGEGQAYLFNADTGSLLYTWDNPNNDGGNVSDSFGTAVAVSDTYAVVGALFENNSTTRNLNGAVYVFSTTTGSLLRTIIAAAPPPLYDAFGYALKIQGDYLFVGCPKIYDGAYGRVFIYNLTDGSLVTTLSAGNLNGYGHAISVKGNYLVVSYYFDNFGTGAVYLYNTPSGNWSDTTLVRKTINPKVDANKTYDYLGSSVAINSTYYAAAAPDTEAVAGVSPRGAVYVFDIATGDLVTTLFRPDNINGVYFGQSVVNFGSTTAGSPQPMWMDEERIWVADWQAQVGAHTQAGKVFAWTF
jgi:hypothetical protein